MEYGCLQYFIFHISTFNENRERLHNQNDTFLFLFSISPCYAITQLVCGECWRVCNLSAYPGLSFHQLFMVTGNNANTNTSTVSTSPFCIPPYLARGMVGRKDINLPYRLINRYTWRMESPLLIIPAQRVAVGI